jgi:hypothetical protein
MFAAFSPNFSCQVRRVLNPWGPQTRGNNPGCMGYNNLQDLVTMLLKQNVSEESSNHQLGNIESYMSDGINCTVGFEERLKNAECYLKLHGPVPKDIYSRLKQIEDCILYLERISPEYFHF